ncbi:hypothetical protein TNCV_347121 [Trichonephila clavipes]|nr:hypothetical protein TNCV_347121 [Trichonephila clavipes]
MPVVNRGLEHHADDSTLRLVPLFLSIFRENTMGWSVASQLSSPSTNLTRGPAARRYLEYPHTTKTLYIYMNVSQGFKPRFYDTTISVAKHFTECAQILSDSCHCNGQLNTILSP